MAIGIVMYYDHKTISLGVRWAPTSSLRPLGPTLGPLGLLDFILRDLRPLRLCGLLMGADARQIPTGNGSENLTRLLQVKVSEGASKERILGQKLHFELKSEAVGVLC